MLYKTWKDREMLSQMTWTESSTSRKFKNRWKKTSPNSKKTWKRKRKKDLSISHLIPSSSYSELHEKEKEKIQATEKLRKDMLYKIKETKANLLALNDEQLQTTTRLTIL